MIDAAMSTTSRTGQRAVGLVADALGHDAAEADDADRDRVEFRVDRDGHRTRVDLHGRARPADELGGVRLRLEDEPERGQFADESGDGRAVEAGAGGELRARLGPVVVQGIEDHREVVPPRLIVARAACRHGFSFAVSQP